MAFIFGIGIDLKEYGYVKLIFPCKVSVLLVSLAAIFCHLTISYTLISIKTYSMYLARSEDTFSIYLLTPICRHIQYLISC